ncbi:MAG: M1 family metallopeptidase [Cyclobacteriaceae bacterium]|nr:M1 family metallopeptidase [Cyclobacteriaceae bacterium]
MKNIFVILLIVASIGSSTAQGLFAKKTYSRQDSLRGSITKERIWWDLLKYDLSVAVNPAGQSIKGSNTIRYKVLEGQQVMQIDLQAPMMIERAIQDGKELEVTHDGFAHFIKLIKNQNPGETNEVRIEFSGKPQPARRAPWDGGFTWAKDSNGKDFIATSCQGIGASLWWPCKDHMYDEPDNGMLISVNVPGSLIAVSNGRLKKEKVEKDKTKTFTWEVVNPINNYGVNINIGDYVRFGEKYKGEKGLLDMDYWVLRANLEKAKIHFKDATRTIEAFEHWFGPYPFYEDSYKLVEVPYLGMEHQSSVTYGNGYQKGYKGMDLSYTGWGLKWDYIIVHESGHEWFANNITYKDIADMWVHEGFTMYSESLFVEYFYGKAAGAEYSRGVRFSIDNKEPLIGDYDVNSEGSHDMYNKGNNLLHTLRQVVNDDEKWRATLRGLNKEFYHQTVTTKQVEDYMAKSLGLQLNAFFDQYLRDHRIPVLEYWVKDDTLLYRWSNCIDAFDMPVKVIINGVPKTLKPTTRPKMEKLETKDASIKVDPDFYVYSFNIMGN